ncbi:MAG: glycosyltransferase family 2 protein [Candidatus Schekmanbacteria bacterium]|nr:glycosyltransferase family 2 protein [Candidatus Schekmanbacteria bacterium]
MRILYNYFLASLSFLAALSWSQLISVYWYFFFLELPKYTFAALSFLPGLKPDTKYNEQIFSRRILANPPLVSIIVPAYNEADTILTTLQSLIKQNYPHKEIIVVDDGSNDATPSVCQPLAEAGRIRYLRNNNRGGKSSALNMGLGYAQGEYIMTADADTLFDLNAVTQALLGFADPGVGAVSGNIRVANAQENLLTGLQAINYLLSISWGRALNARLNILTIVSGAFGIYPRRVLERVGGWDVGPGEDGDLTQKIRKLGLKIAFCHKAVCWTRVPATLAAFIRQQRRWGRTLVRNRLRKHRDFFCLWRADFSFSNFWGALEVLFLNILPTYAFLFYLPWLFVYYRQAVFIILLTGYIFSQLFSFGRFLLIWLFLDYKRENIFLLPYLPLYNLFNFCFFRFIRLWAYSEELLFRRSYTDPQVPAWVLEKSPRW